MKIADIAKIIEAVLFVSGDGVDRDEFKRIYDLSDKELNKCLDILKDKYNESSGINIINYKNKIQFCSNPALADSITEILNPIRERSLTKAALETVAIVAYKQPITRTEIEQIRGVNCDYAVQLLQNNNLIQVVGRKDAVGKPLLFGTTEDFLKRFELNSLEELPNYKELLDRIRVIHSEGDSLYREFSIPEESAEENNGNNDVIENVSADDNANLVSQEASSESDVKNDLAVEAKFETANNETRQAKAKDGKGNKKLEQPAEDGALVDVVEPEITGQANIVEGINSTNDDKLNIDLDTKTAKKSSRRKNLIESLQTLSHDNNKLVESVVNNANTVNADKPSDSSGISSEQPAKLSWQDKLKLRLAEQQDKE